VGEGVEEAGAMSGEAGEERLGMMGNGGIGGFVDDGVGGMGSDLECRLEVGDVARRKGIETGLCTGSCGRL